MSIQQDQKPDLLASHLQVLQLKPGDRLVITCERPLTQELVDYVRRCVAKWTDVPVLLLDKEFKVGVLRGVDAVAPADAADIIV